ncbi:ABC transporter permease [Arachnia propionica]|uniref:ABC transporter permease n=1 Tax=Arachnia propionica TaxID=1750 RepID=A0A3P1TD01_9ACTN|nr:ABC transporter permease [Arachnia propionica]MDO5081817.1 ABC transporter permease [Arachnia propionica]RRD07332.1 ABC transporter permease [Arachnia propionica]
MPWYDVLRLTLGIAVLVGAAMVLLRLHRVPLGRAPVIAVLRATIQLAAIAVLLSGVTQWPLLALAFVTLMLSTASWTAARRAAALSGGRRDAVFAVTVGSVVASGAVLLLGLVPWRAQQVIAVVGIVTGNAMSTVTLLARRLASDLLAHQAEVEGWLALGAPFSRATARLRRTGVREALIPNLDQTRNTGLVTLPGAFIGSLFGGASPVEAASFQLTVLAALLLGGAASATVFSTLAGRATRLPRAEKT